MRHHEPQRPRSAGLRARSGSLSPSGRCFTLMVANMPGFGAEQAGVAGTLRGFTCLRSAADSEVRAPGPAFPRRHKPQLGLHLFSTSSPPLLHLFSTSSPPLLRLFSDSYSCVASRPEPYPRQSMGGLWNQFNILNRWEGRTTFVSEFAELPSLVLPTLLL